MDKQNELKVTMLMLLTILYTSEDFHEFKKEYTRWIWETYFQEGEKKISLKSLDKLISEIK